MTNRARPIALVLLGILLTACGNPHGDQALPATILAAPAGSGFVLQDASGRLQLAPTIRLLVADSGLLVTDTGAALRGPATLPPEARFLRLAADGSISVRNTDEDTYTKIGQIQIGHWRSGATISAGEASGILAGQPGTPGFDRLTPAMFAITRQGPKIRLVLVEYGG